jgi:hypothetical protein
MLRISFAGLVDVVLISLGEEGADGAADHLEHDLT